MKKKKRRDEEEEKTKKVVLQRERCGFFLKMSRIKENEKLQRNTT